MEVFGYENRGGGEETSFEPPVGRERKRRTKGREPADGIVQGQRSFLQGPLGIKLAVATSIRNDQKNAQEGGK